jgi:hypothetical protein
MKVQFAGEKNLPVDCCFTMTILDLILRVHPASFAIMLPKQLKYFTFNSCFSSVIICNGDRSLEILSILVFFTLIAIQQNLPLSISLSIMTCGTVYSLASGTRPSEYFTVPNTYPPISKSIVLISPEYTGASQCLPHLVPFKATQLLQMANLGIPRGSMKIELCKCTVLSA